MWYSCSVDTNLSLTVHTLFLPGFFCHGVILYIESKAMSRCDFDPTAYAARRFLDVMRLSETFTVEFIVQDLKYKQFKFISQLVLRALEGIGLLSRRRGVYTRERAKLKQPLEHTHTVLRFREIYGYLRTNPGSFKGCDVSAVFDASAISVNVLFNVLRVLGLAKKIGRDLYETKVLPQSQQHVQWMLDLDKIWRDVPGERVAGCAERLWYKRVDLPETLPDRIFTDNEPDGFEGFDGSVNCDERALWYSDADPPKRLPDCIFSDNESKEYAECGESVLP